jgi:hypothetical protein
MNSRLSYLSAGVLLCATHWVHAGHANLPSGIYEGGLLLAVAPLDKQRLTGLLRVPDSNCRIYFHGLPRGETYTLGMTTPDAFGFASWGQLTVSYDGDTPIVRLDLPVPPGCEKAAPDLAKRQFRLQEKRPWTGIRLVMAERAHFHDDVHESTRRKAWAVKWDAIAFDKEAPSFLHAEFLGGKKPVLGWLRQEDVHPADVVGMEYARTQLPAMQGAWPQGALPTEVRAYLSARERCEHFAGEYDPESGDSERTRFLLKTMKFECGETERRYHALTAYYAKQMPALKFLKSNAPPQ